MSEIVYWPQCATCSNAQGGLWVPVEEYEIENLQPGDNFMARFIVIGRCSHGKGFKRGTVREERSEVIDVPYWWGEAHCKDAVAALKFFTPGDTRPGHGMVIRI